MRRCEACGEIHWDGLPSRCRKCGRVMRSPFHPGNPVPGSSAFSAHATNECGLAVSSSGSYRAGPKNP